MTAATHRPRGETRLARLHEETERGNGRLAGAVQALTAIPAEEARDGEADRAAAA